MQLFVDLTAIVENIKTIKKQTNKEIMVVLKSDAYGLGAKDIISILRKTAIKMIALNKFSEYMELSSLLEGFKVLILESLTKRQIEQINCSSLIFSINSVEDALELRLIEQETHVHLRIDSGMHRLGISRIEQCLDALAILTKNQNIKIDGIYTHYASDENEEYYYQKQSEYFKQFISLYPFKDIHAAATSSLNKEIIGNLVRVGMAIYGYGNNSLKLKPSLSLYTRPVNIQKVLENIPIGYHQAYVTKAPSTIVTIPLGYDDIHGITEVYYDGKSYAVIGAICMNHMHILGDDKINNLSNLIVLSKNGIIKTTKYNWYHLLISLKKMPKCYIRRGSYDIPTVFKNTNGSYQKYQFRKRSH